MPKLGRAATTRLTAIILLVCACNWNAQAQGTKTLALEHSREHDLERLLQSRSFSISQVVELEDGGFAIAGYVQDDRALGRIDRSFVTLVLDRRGDLRWKFASDSYEENIANALAPLGGGGVVAAGIRRGGEGWLIPFDGTGQPLWNRRSDPAGIVLDRRQLESVAVQRSGSVVVGGRLNGVAGLTIVSPAGKPMTERALNYKDDTWVVALALADNGDVIGAGYSFFVESVPGSRPQRETDVIAFRMNTSSDFVWSRRYQRTGMEVVTAMAPLGDGLVIGGRASSSGSRNWDVLLQTVRSNGELGSRTILDHNNAGNEIRSLRSVPEGVLVAATTRLGKDAAAWVFLFNAEGDVVWQAARAGPIEAMTITREGRIVAVGGGNGRLLVEVLRVQ